MQPSKCCKGVFLDAEKMDETRFQCHLEMHVDVVPEDVHTEELPATDLTGVLLIPMSQQVLVHIAPAGEYLCTQMFT